MTKEILTSENLIEIYENLNDFAIYHQNLGGQKAHRLIKKMWDESKERPCEGSESGIARNEGYDYAYKEILSLLHKTFVP